MSKKEDSFEAQSEQSYQVVVVNIKYGRILNQKVKERPDMGVLDIPKDILKTKQDDEMFRNNVESFVYNTLSRKYGAEVTYCQTWLPLD